MSSEDMCEVVFLNVLYQKWRIVFRQPLRLQIQYGGADKTEFRCALSSPYFVIGAILYHDDLFQPSDFGCLFCYCLDPAARNETDD